MVKPPNTIFEFVIGAIGFVGALVILYFISFLLHFKYHDLAGIVSRVSIDRYPKGQDIFYFCLAFILIPTLTFLFWRAIAKGGGRRAEGGVKTDEEQGMQGKNDHLPLPPLPPLPFIGFKLRLPPSAFLLLDYLLLPVLIYFFFYGGPIDQGPYSVKIHGNIDLFHEGERLAPLNELLRGKIPYRDVYIQHGLFQNAYKPLIASKLFGISIASDRLFNKFIEPLAYVFVYILGRQLFKTRIAALALVIIFCGKNAWISDRYVLSFLALTFLAAYIKKMPTMPTMPTLKNIKNLFRPFAHSPFAHSPTLPLNLLITASGFFTSLSIFYSLDIGLYTLATCGAMMILLAFGNRIFNVGIVGIVGIFFLGSFLGFVPFGIYFLVNGALDDLLKNSFIQGYYQLQIWGLPFPSIKPHLDKFLSIEGIRALIRNNILAWYLPIGFYLAMASVLLIKGISKRFRTEDWLMLIALLAGIISFRSALGRSDIHHLEYAMPYFWICYTMVMERFGLYAYGGMKTQLSQLKPLNKPNFSFIVGIVGILGILVLFVGYLIIFHNPINGMISKLQPWIHPQSIQAAPENLVAFDHERSGGIKISLQQRDEILNTIAYIQQNTRPSETIFDFSNQGGYYFFANRPSPTKYHQISYASTKRMQLKVIADLERHKPKLVIFRTGSWFDKIDNVDNVERNYLVAEYLKSHYKEDAVIGKVVMLRRR
jgi:hypothetical protein